MKTKREGAEMKFCRSSSVPLNKSLVYERLSFDDENDDFVLSSGMKFDGWKFGMKWFGVGLGSGPVR